MAKEWVIFGYDPRGEAEPLRPEVDLPDPAHFAQLNTTSDNVEIDVREGTPKPKRFYEILDFTNATLQHTYPGSHVLTLDQFVWMSGPDFRRAREGTPVTQETYHSKILENLGAKKPIGGSDTAAFVDLNTSPSVSYINANTLKLDASNPSERTRHAVTLANFLIDMALFDSITPRFPVYSDGIQAILESALENEGTKYSAMEGVNQEELGKYIARMKERVRRPGLSDKVVIDGTLISLVGELGLRDTESQVIFTTGGDLSLAIRRYLTQDPLQQVRDQLFKGLYTYQQKEVKTKLGSALRDEQEERRIRSFLREIDIKHDSVFSAYTTSQIPEAFIQAKEINQKLRFPANPAELRIK